MNTCLITWLSGFVLHNKQNYRQKEKNSTACAQWLICVPCSDKTRNKFHSKEGIVSINLRCIELYSFIERKKQHFKQRKNHSHYVFVREMNVLPIWFAGSFVCFTNMPVKVVTRSILHKFSCTELCNFFHFKIWSSKLVRSLPNTYMIRSVLRIDIANCLKIADIEQIQVLNCTI